MNPPNTGSLTTAYLYGGALLALILFILFSGKWREKKRLKYLVNNFGRLGWSRFDLDELKLNYEFSLEKRKEESQVDHITWNDLEMDELLLKNQSFYSSVGAQHIYESLHYFEGKEVIQRRKKLIEMTREDQDVVIETLFSLGEGGGANLPFLLENATEYTFPRRILEVLFASTLLTMVTFPLLKSMGLILLVFLLLTNTMVFYFGSEKIKDRLHSVDYFLSLLKAARGLEKKLSPDQKEYKEELKAVLERFRYVRTSKIDLGSRASAELSVLLELQKVFFLTSLRKFARVASVLRKEKEAGTKLVKLLGETELALFMRAIGKNKELSETAFTKDKTLHFKELYHPMVENAVPYSRENSSKLLVTGSNASGKSTFMKAMGLSVLFSQTTGYAFAKEFSMRPGELLSSMALRDSIEKGESYFVTEIKSLRRILEKTKDHYCYCFIDEILRGTNTVERIASSTSVLEVLGKRESCIYVATHDIELTELLKDYENVHFRESYADEDIVFDYQLLEGSSDTRNAILLLKIMGFGDEIIDQAQSRAENFVQTRRWT